MTTTIRRICSVVGFLLLVSLLDGVVSGYLEPKGICRVFSGKTEIMSGTLPVRIPDEAALAFTSQSPLLTMKFIEAQGILWRAIVHASEQMTQGEYPVTVYLKGQSPDEKSSTSRILVFQQESAYRNSFDSVFRRYLGLSPWTVTSICLPLMLLGFAASFRFSVREEAQLNEAGLSSVFKVTRKKDACCISFGLAEAHHIGVGDSLLVLDKNRRAIGEATVESTGDRHATAAVPRDLKVEPNFLVDMRRGARCSPSPGGGFRDTPGPPTDKPPADANH